MLIDYQPRYGGKKTKHIIPLRAKRIFRKDVTRLVNAGYTVTACCRWPGLIAYWGEQ